MPAVWSVNYFKDPLRAGLAVVLLATFSRRVTDPISRGARSILGGSERVSPWLRHSAYVGLALVMVLPFRALADHRVYGDGHGLMALIANGERFDPHSPLGVLLQSALYSFAHARFGSTVEVTWGFTSCVFGSLFVFVLLVFADALSRNRREKGLFLGLILSLGLLALFFSEVEDYAGSTAFLLAYLYFAHRATSRQTGIFLARLIAMYRRVQRSHPGLMAVYLRVPRPPPGMSPTSLRAPRLSPPFSAAPLRGAQ